MSFWGVSIMHGESYTYHNEGPGPPRRLRITQATLATRSGLFAAKSIVECSVGGKDPVCICSLSNHYSSIPLELEFEESQDIVFSVRGPRGVYLSGYYVRDQINKHHSATQTDFGEDEVVADTECNEIESHENEFPQNTVVVDKSKDDEIKVSNHVEKGHAGFESSQQDDTIVERKKNINGDDTTAPNAAGIGKKLDGESSNNHEDDHHKFDAFVLAASTKDDHPHDVSGPCNVPEAGCSGKLKKKKKGKKVHHESKIISKDAGEMNNQDIGDNHFHIHWKGNKDRYDGSCVPSAEFGHVQKLEKKKRKHKEAQINDESCRNRQVIDSSVFREKEKAKEEKFMAHKGHGKHNGDGKSSRNVICAPTHMPEPISEKQETKQFVVPSVHEKGSLKDKNVKGSRTCEKSSENGVSSRKIVIGLRAMSASKSNSQNKK